MFGIPSGDPGKPRQIVPAAFSVDLVDLEEISSVVITCLEEKSEKVDPFNIDAVNRKTIDDKRAVDAKAASDAKKSTIDSFLKTANELGNSLTDQLDKIEIPNIPAIPGLEGVNDTLNDAIDNALDGIGAGALTDTGSKGDVSKTDDKVTTGKFDPVKLTYFTMRLPMPSAINAAYSHNWADGATSSLGVEILIRI
jgi:hypothetical protein